MSSTITTAPRYRGCTEAQQLSGLGNRSESTTSASLLCREGSSVTRADSQLHAEPCETADGSCAANLGRKDVTDTTGALRKAGR